MKNPSLFRSSVMWSLAALFAVHSAHAQQSTTTNTSTSATTATAPTPLTGPQSVPQNRIAGDFRGFLGPDSETVVSGLRTGHPIVLTEVVPGPTPDAPPTTKTVTIDSPTGPMGNGNVSHTLDLARFQLAQAGIQQPTASQLQAALTGGSVTNASGVTTKLPGVLTLRSEGMGWGQIAHEMGTNLGAVKNGRADPTATASTGASGSTASVGSAHGDTSGAVTSTVAHGHGQGIVTGTGEDGGTVATSSVHGHGHADAVTNAAGASNSGGVHGHEIVDGLGSSGSANGNGHVVSADGSTHVTGHDSGAGIVDGLGAGGDGVHGNPHISTNLDGSTNGGGNGGGNGNGHGHGN
jgi:hypothetical protein